MSARMASRASRLAWMSLMMAKKLAYGQVASTLSALGRGIFQRWMGVIVALLGIVGAWKALVALGYV